MKKKRVIGTAERPRLVVVRSIKHISVQVIDDTAGKTLVSATTIGGKAVKNGGNIAAAKTVGKLIAEKAAAAGIKRVVFDRNGFLYHGRIKSLAEAAREGGLQF